MLAAVAARTLVKHYGKNAHHIQELYADLKKKDDTINKLLARINEKKEEVHKLKTIIRSQTKKNLTEYHFPSEADN